MLNILIIPIAYLILNTTKFIHKNSEKDCFVSHIRKNKILYFIDKSDVF